MAAMQIRRMERQYGAAGDLLRVVDDARGLEAERSLLAGCGFVSHRRLTVQPSRSRILARTALSPVFFKVTFTLSRKGTCSFCDHQL